MKKISFTIVSAALLVGFFRQRRISLWLIFFLLSIFFQVSAVSAADPKPTIRDEKGYSASFVSQSEQDPIVMEAGSSKWVIVTFKNTGTATWDNTGVRYISAYTMQPRDRASVFSGAGWESAKQIGRMAGKVAPGKTGQLGIYLHAPLETGEYTEEFYLAAENYSWVSGGYFFLKIKVTPRKTPVVTPPSTPTTTPATTTPPAVSTTPIYKAKRIMQSKKTIEAAGGERIKLVLGYQNIGTTPWKNIALRAGEPSILSSISQIPYADESWLGDTRVFEQSVSVAASDVLRKDVYIRTPAKKGAYTATFSLTVDGKVVDTVSIPVTVTSNAPSNYYAPVFRDEDDNNPPVTIDTPRLSEEPRIKVGLWAPKDTTAQIVSYEDDYIVYDGVTRESLGILSQKKIATLKYVKGMYTLTGGGLDIESKNYIRLEPQSNPHAVFIIYNWDRTVAWKAKVNFNEYRGAVEYRKGEKSDEIWVVEDVLFHDYAKGVSENANNSPVEYLKAQSVAQVSYAYAIQHSGKHGIFDVVATTADQLYLGYASEKVMPNFVAAIEDVRGYMVTYNDEVVITPYYAHSDGRTRSWKEVWGGGDRPWLVSVDAKYDKGSKMLGHGVGMSQIDASERAKNDGWDWQQLLAHYYTGTKVTLMYE